MRTLMKYLLLTVPLVGLCSCGNPSDSDTGATPVVIAYFSWQENRDSTGAASDDGVAALSKIVQNEIGGMLVSLQAAEPYPADPVQYEIRLAAEQSGLLPALCPIDPLPENLVVFLVYPSGEYLPPVVSAFLLGSLPDGCILAPVCICPSGETMPNAEEIASTVPEGVSVLPVLWIGEGEFDQDANAMVKCWLEGLYVSGLLRV